MEQYIEKAKVVTEIEKRIKETEAMQPKFDQFWAGQISAFKGVIKILDTLEVKEVDLEEEMNKYFDDNFYITETWGIFSEKTENEINLNDLEDIAKHFYKLGLKTQKGGEL